MGGTEERGGLGVGGCGVRARSTMGAWGLVGGWGERKSGRRWAVRGVLGGAGEIDDGRVGVGGSVGRVGALELTGVWMLVRQ